ncbi:MAG TPA: protein kinase, partial [Acidobacteriota bacterium]|nr:protein kinase [Acidobacteriota bacterium]
ATGHTEHTSFRTAERELTTEGIVMGTLQYMSPEQVEGKRVDHRSDIFSFGTLLYEMATGKKAFEGDSQASLIASILKEDPKPILESEPLFPPALDGLVRTCLAKDPEQRWQNIQDVLINLKWVSENIHQPQSDALQTRNRKRWLWLTIGILLGTLSALPFFWMRKEAPQKRNVVRFAIPLPTIDRLAGLDIALSPDGRKLVYSASSNELQQLFLKPLDQQKSEPIKGTEGGRYPFFSPEGQWIGFFADNAVKKVLLPGGEPITICTVSDSRFEIGATWGHDDSIVFGLKGEGLQIVSAQGGNPKPIAKADSGFWYGNPQYLKNGTHILATLISGTTLKQQVALIDIRNGERKILLDGGSSAILPSGELIYEMGMALYAAPFDQKQLKVTGRSVPVLEGKDEIYADSRTFVIGENGTLVYVPVARSETRLLWVDRKGQTSLVQPKVELFRYPTISPDGKRIAASIRTAAGGDVWLYDAETGNRSRLTVEGANVYPVWTEDGKHIAFTSTQSDSGTSGIYWVLADGTANAELLLKGERVSLTKDGKTHSVESLPFPGSFSPDGKYLAFRQNHSSTGEDIMILSISDKKVTPFAATRFTEMAPAFSPDGNWIAYQSDESGQDQIYAKPFNGTGAKIPISTEGGRAPIWSKDSSELFFRHGNTVQSVKILLTPKFTVSQPEQLFEGLYEPPSTGGSPYYDVSPDGTRFVMLQSIEAATQKQLQVVLNWDEEVKKAIKPQEH